VNRHAPTRVATRNGVVASSRADDARVDAHGTSVLHPLVTSVSTRRSSPFTSVPY